MNIIKDRDLINDIEKYDVILVGTNILCSLYNGFQSKIRLKYPEVEEANNKRYGDKRKLGKRLTIYDTTPIISLMFITKLKKRNSDYLDYEALENSLKSADIEFAGKKVATTLLGASPYDGYGDKERILKLFNENVKKMDLYLYDYEQLDRIKEGMFIKNKIKELESIDYEKYQNLWGNRYNIYKKLYIDYPDGKRNK